MRVKNSNKNMTSNITVPGLRICSSNECKSGEGTYIRGDFIYSSLCGEIKYTKSVNQTVVSVSRNAIPTVIPTVSCIVTGVITKTTPQHATVSIMIIHDAVHGDITIPSSSIQNHIYTGIIRYL